VEYVPFFSDFPDTAYRRELKAIYLMRSTGGDKSGPVKRCGKLVQNITYLAYTKSYRDDRVRLISADFYELSSIRFQS
jgi:hypothetical protein